MAAPLLLSKRFAPLFWCQFFAAFNDNFLKTALVFLILFKLPAAEAPALITLAGAVFIAPFFFLSAFGGQLADRYDKAQVARRVKLVEIGVAAIAVAGYMAESLAVLFVALFGFGVLAALFGPVKYGILPDHLRRNELPAANALVEGATFIAILTGTIAGGLASRGGNVAAFAPLLMGIALACWIAALFIPPAGIGAPHLRVSYNIATSTIALFRYLRSDTRRWWGALVVSWFWAVGIVALSLLPPLIKLKLGGNEDTVTAYLALFSIAIGIGSALAAAIARGRIVLGTTLAGAVLIGAFALDLGIAFRDAADAPALRGPLAVMLSPLGLRASIDLFGMAVAGGLFVVPAFAAVQAWSEVAHRARVIAAVNVLNAGFMTLATVAVAVLQKAGVSVPMLFAGVGALGLLAALAIWRTMPEHRLSSPA